MVVEKMQNKYKQKIYIHELIAKFIGMFLIVQIGCGSVCTTVSKSTQFGTAATWSVAVTLAIVTTTSVSGAHSNPAITFASLILREFEWK